MKRINICSVFYKKQILLFLMSPIIFNIYQNSLNARPSINLSDSSIHVLFVGNSLTYANNLPLIVSELAKEKGINIKTEMIARPNYALEDHWNDRKLEMQLMTNKYDFVIIQQGPSSQMDGRIMLAEYGLKMKILCGKYNARLVFFMVWPALSNFQTFDGVIKNYTDAASVTNSILCPVGVAWKNYFLETNDYSYYGPDQFHPSKKGSEAAAKIIVDTLLHNFNHP